MSIPQVGWDGLRRLQASVPKWPGPKCDVEVILLGTSMGSMFMVVILTRGVVKENTAVGIFAVLKQNIAGLCNF